MSKTLQQSPMQDDTYRPQPNALPKLVRRVVHVDDDKMRAMRLWHYEHALAATKRRDDPRSTPASRALARQSWSFHMGCVQAMNDLFPMGDTAEGDQGRAHPFAPLLTHRVPA